MTDPRSDEHPAGAPARLEPTARSERVLDRWFGRLLRVMGAIVGIGLWLLVFEILLLL